MGALFGGPSIPDPTPPPPLPEPKDPAVEEAKRKQRMAQLRRRGRAATILTNDEDALGTPTIARPGVSRGSPTLG